jgi:hypothetical protein
MHDEDEQELLDAVSDEARDTGNRINKDEKRPSARSSRDASLCRQAG